MQRHFSGVRIPIYSSIRKRKTICYTLNYIYLYSTETRNDNWQVLISALFLCKIVRKFPVCSSTSKRFAAKGFCNFNHLLSYLNIYLQHHGCISFAQTSQKLEFLAFFFFCEKQSLKVRIIRHWHFKRRTMEILNQLLFRVKKS